MEQHSYSLRPAITQITHTLSLISSDRTCQQSGMITPLIYELFEHQTLKNLYNLVMSNVQFHLDPIHLFTSVCSCLRHLAPSLGGTHGLKCNSLHACVSSTKTGGSHIMLIIQSMAQADCALDIQADEGSQSFPNYAQQSINNHSSGAASSLIDASNLGMQIVGQR